MSDSSPEIWEIWHARFEYEGNSGYKYRPVIIVDVLRDGTLVMMVTSTNNKLQLMHDYQIQDWKNAGLEKPSIARADRLAYLPPAGLGSAGLIGRLSDRDIFALTDILAEIASD